MFGGFERRRATTVMPVPPGTALHQLCSVPPAGRHLNSAAGRLVLLVSDIVRVTECV